MAVPASTIITNVRDLIPDPVFDANGNALDNDGALFRTSTLVRFLNNAVNATAQKIAWQIIDWTATASATYQSDYDVDNRWISLSNAFANQWQLVMISKPATVFPTRPVQRPLWWSINNLTDHLSVSFYPTPNTTDPSTTLSATISSTATAMTITATANFFTYGYLRIENELIAYGTINSGGPAALERGAGGTVAAQHLTGASVTHCGLWMYGPRVPTQITTYTSNVELPLAFQYPLELFVLSRCARAQNDDQSAQSYMQEYENQMDRIMASPGWRRNQGVAIRSYGSTPLGPLWQGRIIVP